MNRLVPTRTPRSRDAPRIVPARRTGRATTIAVALIAAAFVLELIVERLWLSDGPESTVELVGEARGIVISLLVAAVTLAAAVRGRLSPFRTSLRPGSERRPDLVNLTAWFLRMRWLACATSTVLILVTVDVLHLLPGFALLPLLSCVAALAIANLAFAAALRRRPQASQMQVVFQVVVDLLILTFMLHFSGGIENPLSLLFLFHVIIAGILFSRARCFQVAALAFVLFAGLASAEYSEIVPHYTLRIFPHDLEAEDAVHAAHHGTYVASRILLQALLLLITGYFITTIMESLRAREEETRRMAAREAKSRERLESVVDAAGAGLRLLDKELQPIWTNARFRAWAPGEAQVEVVTARTLRDGRTRVTEHRIDRRDGTSRHLATTVSAMRDPDGAVHNVVQLVQDVTARKKAEAESLHAGKLAAVGELAGNVAHEINNPLGILSARLHLLLGRHSVGLPAGIEADLRKMTELADRMTKITRALLDYSRPDVSRKRPAAIGPVVDRATALMQTRASRKDVRIESSVDVDTPVVRIDTGEIEQVLVNLLMNATDASAESSTVAVSAIPIPGSSGSRGLRITVHDSGPGVPVAMRARIFEPFFSTKEAGRGTGLGLSICQRIIREHGGSIRVTDASAGGACFEVDLPAGEEEGAG